MLALLAILSHAAEPGALPLSDRLSNADSSEPASDPPEPPPELLERLSSGVFGPAVELRQAFPVALRRADEPGWLLRLGGPTHIGPDAVTYLVQLDGAWHPLDLIGVGPTDRLRADGALVTTDATYAVSWDTCELVVDGRAPPRGPRDVEVPSAWYSDAGIVRVDAHDGARLDGRLVDASGGWRPILGRLDTAGVPACFRSTDDMVKGEVFVREGHAWLTWTMITRSSPATFTDRAWTPQEDVPKAKILDDMISGAPTLCPVWDPEACPRSSTEILELEASEQAAGALDRFLGHLRWCHSLALRERSPVDGEVRLVLDIADQRVATAQADGLDDRWLLACVTDRARRYWTFPGVAAERVRATIRVTQQEERSK